MARKTQPTSANFDFPVKLESVSVPSLDGEGFVTDDKFKVTRRMDTGALLGQVRADYGLVQTSELVDMVEESFGNKGLTDFERKAVVARGGARTYIQYDFKNQVREIKSADRKVGDEVGLRLTLNNSYDGTCRISFALGALRLTCLNGMTTLDREHELTRKHTKNISTAFISEGLGFALLSFESQVVKFQDLADKELTHEQGFLVLNNLVKSKVITERVRKGIAQIWENPRKADEARNLWNLNNAATDYLTHQVNDERFEYANRINRKVLGSLHRASVSETSFKGLLVPVKEEAELALN